MALRPQTSPGLQDMLAVGMVRVGTTGELYKPDGTALVLGAAALPKAAAVPNAVAAPTKAEFDALLVSLRNAGYLAP